MDDDIVPQQADLGAPEHLAIHHVCAGHSAHLGNLEGVPNLRSSQVLLTCSGIQQTHHGILDFVMDFVDDRVEADVNLFLVRQIGGGSIGADIEPNDYCSKPYAL